MQKSTYLEALNKKESYFQKYLRLLSKQLKKINSLVGNGKEPSIQDESKLVYYSIKVINLDEKEYMEYQDILGRFRLIQHINSTISSLTPRQFEKIFPITKDYDGEQYGRKDYYFTRAMMEEKGMDQEIGKDVESFLCDYHNWQIRLYIVETMSILSKLQRLREEKDLFTELPSCNECLTKSKITKVKRPVYLRLIK
ncbi:hypothetical protein P4654_02125 [Niallia taxi]|uniref:hypothetical protein n=1 Tax=Niallia taxi TaxID=2499688 RepID=UPI002E20EFED|nr:hypothetical protein [Niallia taxi]MED4118097.1 hypothetical protein [Niallia taxi]